MLALRGDIFLLENTVCWKFTRLACSASLKAKSSPAVGSRGSSQPGPGSNLSCTYSEATSGFFSTLSRYLLIISSVPQFCLYRVHNYQVTQISEESITLQCDKCFPGEKVGHHGSRWKGQLIQSRTVEKRTCGIKSQRRRNNQPRAVGFAGEAGDVREGQLRGCVYWSIDMDQD